VNRGLVIPFGGAVKWRSRNQKPTALSTTDAEYYAFGVGWVRLTQILHHLTELGIWNITHVFSDSQSVSACIKLRIYCGTAVPHSATKYYLAADMAGAEEIDMCYLPTAVMLADCFTLPLPKLAFLKQCAAMVLVGIGLENSPGTHRNW